MIFQQIRNATIKITYQNKVILIDPWLAKKGSLRSIESPDPKKNTIKNPTAELPMSISDIVDDVDVCIITHNHIDHFDEVSINYLNKEIKILVQNNDDLKIIKDLGFNDIELLNSSGTIFDGVTIIQTKGQHGESKESAEGPVSGAILKGNNEKIVYICGDTIWYNEIAETIKKYQPEVIVLNACDARLKSGRLIMNLDDIKEVHEFANDANIIVSHMEAVNHAYVNRVDVKKFVKENNLKKIYIPDDGESYKF